MSVLDEIAAERRHQDQKWGHRIDDNVNTPWHWGTYLSQYATKWQIGSFAPLNHRLVEDFRRRMIQVAAIAIAAVESLDRQRAEKGNAFYEHK